MRLRNLSIVGALALLAACGGRPSTGGPPAAAAAPPVAAGVRADRIRAAAAAAASVAGRRDGPGGRAAWRAFFAGGELALVEESVEDPPRPPLGNRYYFEHGALFYFSGEQPAERGSGATGAVPRTPVIVEFDGARAVRAVRVEHYGEVPLEPARVAAIRQRAAELAAAARDEASARKVGP